MCDVCCFVFLAFVVGSRISSLSCVFVASCVLRAVCACGSCLVSLCIVCCIGFGFSSLSVARLSSAGVPPGNKLGENGWVEIGKALEKNETLGYLNLEGAPLVCSFCFSLSIRSVGVLHV